MDPRKTWRCVYGHSMTDEQRVRTGCPECLRELASSNYYKTLIQPGIFIVVRRQELKDGCHNDIVGNVTTYDAVNDILTIGLNTEIINAIILDIGG